MGEQKNVKSHNRIVDTGRPMKKAKRFVISPEKHQIYPSTVNARSPESLPVYGTSSRTQAIPTSNATFPWYELALPATILAFVVFGILLVLGFAIYKILQSCLSTSTRHQKRRLTPDNIFYKSLRKSKKIVNKRLPTYRYRFIRSLSVMEPEADNEAEIGVDVKSRKSPPPSPATLEAAPEEEEDEQMQTPEASPSVVVAMQLPVAPSLPSFPIQPPERRDDLNSNLHLPSFSYLQGDVCCVQPIFRSPAGRESPKSLSNKENAAPSSSLGTLSSPKIPRSAQDILKEQSPRQTTDSSTSSPLFTACEVISGTGSASRFSFSPKIIKDMGTGSPLLPSAGLKHGNYFKFPEVDVFTPTKQEENNNRDPESLETTPLIEQLSLADEIQAKDEVSKKNVQNANLLTDGRTKPRRVRLKSISLDSDGARLVGENIAMPVEELVEMTHPTMMDESCASSFDIRKESELIYQYSSSHRHQHQHHGHKGGGRSRKSSKNIHNLTINVNQPTFEDLVRRPETSSEIAIPPPPQTPKTPIQKAASLDSEPTYLSIPHPMKAAPSNAQSVPSTPKRQPFSTPKMLKSVQKIYTTANKSYGCLRQPVSSEGSSKFSRKLRSYDESISTQSFDSEMLPVGDSETGKGNSLQVAKFSTLSVSNNNLKTLPEVTMVNDFDDCAASVASIRAEPLAAQTTKSKSSILQRRGSNHSLTLNIDGGGSSTNSVTNLARGLSLSNYSLGTMQGSSYNLHNQQGPGLSIYVDPAIHKSTTGQQHQAKTRCQSKLLQRRGSNASLILNIQESNSSLNRFCSHNSLNMFHNSGHEKRKGLLERRDSNRSLTLNIGKKALSVSSFQLGGFASNSLHRRGTQQDSCDHPDGPPPEPDPDPSADRRFYSSENLTHFAALSSKYSSTFLSQGHSVGGDKGGDSRQTPYGSVDELKRSHILDNAHIDMDEIWSTEGAVEATRNIVTKPLSPQSNSEDFIVYLANIQCLQNASNVLTEKQLTSLGEMFQKSYHSKAQSDNPLMDSTGIFLTQDQQDEEEDQKKTIIKLHQEFWDLPTNYQEKPIVFGSQVKNRYKTILPNETSRVRLDPECGQTQEPYINANYIKGPDYTQNCYIATQGPMQNTIYEFWLMVVQNVGREAPGGGHEKIAMLTDFVENNRQKCAAYFPKDKDDVLAFSSTNRPEDDELVLRNRERILREASKSTDLDDEDADFRPSFNFFLIRNADVRCKNGYSIRKLRIVYSFDNANASEDDCRTLVEFPVFHYWFPDWPDHRSPDDIDVLLDMSLDLLDGDCDLDFPSPPSTELTVDSLSASPESVSPCKSTSTAPLPVIHCSAGIGRTGCLVAILNGLRQMRASISTETTITAEAETRTSTLSVDILGIVCNLRLQRGGMVQNSEQYELIHRALCLYHQRLNMEQEKNLSTQL